MRDDAYFMSVARGVRETADCHGHQVGAVLALGGHILVAESNGTPTGMLPCTLGGCFRCANRDTYQPGLFYDMCICVHAEAGCLAYCAKNGVPIEDAVLYTTLSPCLQCCKELIQAGVREVVYEDVWDLRMPEFTADHSRLLKCLSARRFL